MEILYIASLFLIMLQTGGLWAQLCPGSKITQNERETLIKGHNERRQKLANGGEFAKGNARMPKAKNMAKMVWDCSLEDTAQRYSEVCVWEHSSKAFRNNAGENLYESHASYVIPRKGQVEAAMKGWWDEVKDMTAGTLFKDSTESGKMIGHFTQMAWGNSAKIGCGYAKCPRFPTHESWTKDVVYITCHYSLGGNILNQHIYNTGKPCSECWHYPGSNCVNGLCSDGKKICFNKYSNCDTLCSSEHKNDCPIACKTCGDGPAGSSTGGGRGSGSISPSVSKACRDLSKNCSKFSTRCYNNDIKNICRKSCNAC